MSLLDRLVVTLSLNLSGDTKSLNNIIRLTTEFCTETVTLFLLEMTRMVMELTLSTWSLS